ncbi:uncharacterized protein L203_105391 [Cryptococcus depauperatus CBS 7841]|uniref:Uncharacterized protein n=1 Tax=Cryptococcus depauperatus CBS 7841 TaxID=1295531 RepID=A0A1E3IEL1_9TREE|nr:hypothetical protein L203_04068 [Cryptococcus depauperatus CBS 7841]
MNHQTDLFGQELHLLYVLLDSNLPTGGFVSSSGLESFAKHGFLSSSYAYSSGGSASSENGNKNVMDGLVRFAKAEVANYASTTGGFVRDAWILVTDARAAVNRDMMEIGFNNDALAQRVDHLLEQLQVLDQYHESTLLSHVGRRSSEPQGVAMLTLFSRGLSKPPGMEAELQDEDDITRVQEELGKRVVEGYKKLVRLQKAPGHLAVCWGLMCAALGLSIDRTLHLYLFMHARSLLSSAVRLNLIGPYASSQLLLHPYRLIIKEEVDRLQSCTTSILDVQEKDYDEFWAWAEDVEKGPETTWPLGEILMGRHDLQHSAIFNS